MAGGGVVIERGDISNEVAPKLFFVLEDLIAHVHEDDQKRAARYARRGAWKLLANLYNFDGKMIAHLWDLVWRTNYSFSLVTIASGDEEWMEALERRLDRFNVPYSGLVGFSTVDELAQHVVFMPNILRLYHGREEWKFKFGRVGEHVPDATVFQVQ